MHWDAPTNIGTANASALPPRYPEILDVDEHICGIAVHAKRSRLLQFFLAITSSEEAYPKSSSTPCGEHVPHAVANNDAILHGNAQPFSCCQKYIRGGLGLSYIVTRDHDCVLGQTQVLLCGLCSFHVLGFQF
jgi:hypothetical protein